MFNASQRATNPFCGVSWTLQGEYTVTHSRQERSQSRTILITVRASCSVSVHGICAMESAEVRAKAASGSAAGVGHLCTTVEKTAGSCRALMGWSQTKWLCTEPDARGRGRDHFRPYEADNELHLRQQTHRRDEVWY